MKRAFLVGLLLLGACSRSDSDRSGFSGTWVMHVDERPFAVLTLEPEDGRFVGTLTRPRRMTTDGRTFSGVSRETTKDGLTGDAQDGRTLRFVTTSADDPNDKTEFELTVTAPGEGTLTIVGAPFPPWRVVRDSVAGSTQVWTGWNEKRSYPLEAPYVVPNAEMAAIYKADQAVRESMESFQAQSKQIEKDDAARRERTRVLIEKGDLKAGEDFRLAAMVFQHGNEPRDYLFAHTLALVALAKGDPSAAWIASASMDRYLTSIGQAQIFGSQFGFDGKSRGAFDRELISDALRRELGVPALAEQEAQMRKLLKFHVTSSQ